MEISQLEYFVILARIKHFTKAARSVAITQSALSHSIGKLERENIFCRMLKKPSTN